MNCLTFYPPPSPISLICRPDETRQKAAPLVGGSMIGYYYLQLVWIRSNQVMKRPLEMSSRKHNVLLGMLTKLSEQLKDDICGDWS